MFDFDPVTVHRLFGVIVLAFSTMIALRELDQSRWRWAEFLPAIALLLAGLLLAGDSWLFHGGDFGAEGHQHLLLGLVLMAAGVLESYRAFRGARILWLEFVLPAVLIVLGASFLWHHQHATTDPLLQMSQHRVMGATLMFAGLLKVASSLRWRLSPGLRVGWPLVLIVFAGELLLYLEPGDSVAKPMQMNHLE